MIGRAIFRKEVVRLVSICRDLFFMVGNDVYSSNIWGFIFVGFYYMIIHMVE